METSEFEDAFAYKKHAGLNTSGVGYKSDSSDGKSDFDDCYFDNKPPPLPIDDYKLVQIQPFTLVRPPNKLIKTVKIKTKKKKQSAFFSESKKRKSKLSKSDKTYLYKGNNVTLNDYVSYTKDIVDVAFGKQETKTKSELIKAGTKGNKQVQQIKQKEDDILLAINSKLSLKQWPSLSEKLTQTQRNSITQLEPQLKKDIISNWEGSKNSCPNELGKVFTEMKKVPNIKSNGNTNHNPKVNIKNNRNSRLYISTPCLNGPSLSLSSASSTRKLLNQSSKNVDLIGNSDVFSNALTGIESTSLKKSRRKPNKKVNEYGNWDKSLSLDNLHAKDNTSINKNPVCSTESSVQPSFTMKKRNKKENEIGDNTQNNKVVNGTRKPDLLKESKNVPCSEETSNSFAKSKNSIKKTQILKQSSTESVSCTKKKPDKTKSVEGLGEGIKLSKEGKSNNRHIKEFCLNRSTSMSLQSLSSINKDNLINESPGEVTNKNSAQSTPSKKKRKNRRKNSSTENENVSLSKEQKSTTEKDSVNNQQNLSFGNNDKFGTDEILLEKKNRKTTKQTEEFTLVENQTNACFKKKLDDLARASPSSFDGSSSREMDELAIKHCKAIWSKMMSNHGFRINPSSSSKLNFSDLLYMDLFMLNFISTNNVPNNKFKKK